MHHYKVILHLLSYYLQFLLVPLIFVVRLLSGFRDAFEDVYDTCKRAYYEHRMHYRGF